MRPSGKADERGPTSSRNERRVSDQLPAIGSFRFPRVAMLAPGRLPHDAFSGTNRIMWLNRQRQGGGPTWRS